MKPQQDADDGVSGPIRITDLKLSPPTRSSFALQRQSLDFSGFVTRDASLVLCNAPAGFGKSSVMLQWLIELQTAGVATAWLTLDPQDNDLIRFLTYLATSFRRISNSIDAEPLPASVFDSQIVPSGVVLELIDRLSSVGRPFALFLDDYESITRAAIHEIVRQIVEHLPAGSHLIIGTRTAPPLGLGRLRAHGRLSELGMDQLRFSLAEASAYLHSNRHLPVSERDVRTLHQCTEGWATGLHLAALSLAGQSRISEIVKRFSGSQTEIAEYLTEDVLSRQPDEIMQFLLEVSVLDTLTGPLCDAVSRRNDSQELLERIEHANLFLIPLDVNRSAYRFHNLFAEYLRNQLRRQDPVREKSLHSRAARWFETEHRIVPAVEHALAAGDLEMAARLLDDNSENLLYSGRVDTLARWVESLSTESLDQRPRLRLSYAWALTFLHRYQEARAQLDELHLAAPHMLSPKDRDEILTLDPTILIFSDRIDECRVAADQNLPLLSGQGDFARGALCNIYSFCLASEADFDQASELLATAKRMFMRAGSIYGLTYSECLEGVIHYSHGRLHVAHATFQSAFRRAIEHARYSSASAVAAIYLAEALYDIDDTTAAEELILDYLPIIEQTGLPDHIIVANRILARLALERGDYEDAHRHLNDMEYLGIARESPRIVATSRLERAFLAMRIGDLEQATAILERMRGHARWAGFGTRIYHASETEDLSTNCARLLIVSQRSAEAASALASEIAHLSNSRRYVRLLLLRMLHARALHDAGERDEAWRQFHAQRELAEQAGFARLIIDNRSFLAPLLTQARTDGNGRHAIDPIASSNAAPSADMSLDPLTDRELHVLRLVADGLSNRAIADSLFVSEATVKTHLRNINSKLDVHSRTQAIAVARARHIL